MTLFVEVPFCITCHSEKYNGSRGCHAHMGCEKPSVTFWHLLGYGLFWGGYVCLIKPAEACEHNITAQANWFWGTIPLYTWKALCISWCFTRRWNISQGFYFSRGSSIWATHPGKVLSYLGPGRKMGCSNHCIPYQFVHQRKRNCTGIFNWSYGEL